MQQLEKERLSHSLYVLRFFAILTVITAHISFGEGFAFQECLRIAVGQIGVVIFYILSGFFYKRTKSDWKQFWIKRLKRIVIPWLIIGSATFALSVIINRGNNYGVLSYFMWILGIKTWFWFVPSILITYFIYGFINGKAHYLMIALSAFSITLSVVGIFKYNDYFNQYTNPFNWFGFFSVGCLMKNNDFIGKLIGRLPLSVSAVVAVAFLILSAKLRFDTAYINPLSIIIELSGFVLFLNISYFAFYKSRCLSTLGKESFFIYLTHMQICGLLNTRLPFNNFFFILRPFIMIAIMGIITFLLLMLFEKLKLSKYRFIIGL